MFASQRAADAETDGNRETTRVVVVHPRSLSANRTDTLGKMCAVGRWIHLICHRRTLSRTGGVSFDGSIVRAEVV